ncbi:unnamed protein product [Nezara viridula]|uniref:Uncharacterized protein n=1 Tax=Nezara viridula TaxID=85310 RepID=A0A9P0E8F5_NEZVI|nr:unnamed protein product [Nezara viridula]
MDTLVYRLGLGSCRGFIDDFSPSSGHSSRPHSYRLVFFLFLLLLTTVKGTAAGKDSGGVTLVADDFSLLFPGMARGDFIAVPERDSITFVTVSSITMLVIIECTEGEVIVF